MQRRILMFAVLLAVVSGGLLFPSAAALKEGGNARARSLPVALRKILAQGPRVIKGIPWGPTEADAEAAKAKVLKSAPVRAQLRGARHRILSFELVEQAKED